ncbi:hypothetical protein JXB31_05150 [Candidatus Woesearchaeota archaeon]|nr:hypothetical protein [Candidatus Woesearchaeota archaeon]
MAETKETINSIACTAGKVLNLFEHGERIIKNSMSKSGLSMQNLAMLSSIYNYKGSRGSINIRRTGNGQAKKRKGCSIIPFQPKNDMWSNEEPDYGQYPFLETDITDMISEEQGAEFDDEIFLFDENYRRMFIELEGIKNPQTYYALLSLADGDNLSITNLREARLGQRLCGKDRVFLVYELDVYKKLLQKHKDTKPAIDRIVEVGQRLVEDYLTAMPKMLVTRTEAVEFMYNFSGHAKMATSILEDTLDRIKVESYEHHMLNDVYMLLEGLYHHSGAKMPDYTLDSLKLKMIECLERLSDYPEFMSLLDAQGITLNDHIDNITSATKDMIGSPNYLDDGIYLTINSNNSWESFEDFIVTLNNMTYSYMEEPAECGPNHRENIMTLGEIVYAGSKESQAGLIAVADMMAAIGNHFMAFDIYKEAGELNHGLDAQVNHGILGSCFNILDYAKSDELEITKAEKRLYMQEGLRAAKFLANNHAELRDDDMGNELSSLISTAYFYALNQKKGFKAAKMVYEKILSLYEEGIIDDMFTFKNEIIDNEELMQDNSYAARASKAFSDCCLGYIRENRQLEKKEGVLPSDRIPSGYIRPLIKDTWAKK